MQRRPAPPAGQRGFTLVELMIVVVILGILASLAVVTFRKYMTNAKSAEAPMVMRAIAAAQERYRGEHLTYLDVSSDGTNSLLTRYYPMATGDIGKARYNWNNPTGLDYARWRILAPSVTVPVAFGYSTSAGLPGTAPPATGLGTQPVWPTATRPWYVVQSRAVVDGVTTIRVLSSYSNHIAEQNQ